jgi:CheY-like chemotaxis protein
MEIKMVKKIIKQKKILVVDDELMLLMTMQRMLENLYDVTTAVGGREAIKIIDKQEKPLFDLIICDIYMPDMNGVNLYLHIIKNHPYLQNRIIFMTGGALTTEIEEFLQSNKNMCLSKPFEYSKFLQAIKDSIDKV